MNFHNSFLVFIKLLFKRIKDYIYSDKEIQLDETEDAEVYFLIASEGSEVWNSLAIEALSIEKRIELDPNKSIKLMNEKEKHALIERLKIDYLPNFKKDLQFVSRQFSSSMYSFSEFIFPMSIYFRECTFGYSIGFQNTIYCRLAFFVKCQFYGSTFFNNAIFEERVSFSYTEFGYSFADFTKVKFKSSVDFSYAEFWGALFVFTEFTSKVEFDYASFQCAPNFSDATLPDEVSFRDVKFSLHKGNNPHDDARNYRIMKKQMMNRTDRELEMMFFSLEMDSIIKYNAKAGNLRSKKRALELRIFRFFSSYGRSFFRPMFFLFICIYIFSFLYLVDISGEDWVKNDVNSWSDVELKIQHISVVPSTLKYSVAVAFPYIPTSRTVITNFHKKHDFSERAYYLSITQSVLSTVFVFLAALALKNKFRLN